MMGPSRARSTARGRTIAAAGLAAGAVTLWLTIAGDPGPWAARGPSARILHPHDGAVLGSPVPVVLAADGVALAPCGAPVPCEGHLTVLVDRPCLADGELVPSASIRAAELGVHALTDGSRVVLLDLDEGPHTICVQLADGVRIAFGATDTVAVTVDHGSTHRRREVVATVPPDVGRSGVGPARSTPWPAPTSVTASPTSP